MIIKHLEERQSDLAILNELLTRPYIHANTKAKIQREIGNIHSGLKGEKDAAYHINFYYGKSKNWAIIHDLRLKLGKDVAQIDHLLINRFLEVYICESKRFREGVAINSYGEFARYEQGKLCGIFSPIEQVNRHKLLLKRLFNSGKIELPKRLGLRMKPSLHSLILFSDDVVIRRPKNGKCIADLERVIKIDQLQKRINQDIDDKRPSALLHQFISGTKVISSNTLMAFARQLAALHKPLQTDWEARFGIQKTPTEMTVMNTLSKTSPRYFCFSCGKTVTSKVAYFCWNNKSVFHGKVYCFNCQKNIKQP